jgi:hypothetical protein
MPAPLLQAHQDLDRAVERCSRPEPFPSDRHRVEYLFALYEKLTAPLVAAAKQKRARLASNLVNPAYGLAWPRINARWRPRCAPVGSPNSGLL